MAPVAPNTDATENHSMAKVFVALGSNLGDRRAHLETARRELACLPETSLLQFSPIYETAPVGPPGQDPYLNAAACIQTALDPYDLLDRLRGIEKLCGRTDRKRRIKWGPRTLDLDILFYDDRIISSEELVVPHPMLHERWFVLKPLADLAPQWVHPILEMAIQTLLAEVEKKQRASGNDGGESGRHA